MIEEINSLQMYLREMSSYPILSQEEEIEFQTLELEATLMRDDSQYHEWKNIVEELPTETEAVNVIKALLGITGA